MDIIDNVVPFISGEEDKLEIEAQKILGNVNHELTGFVDHQIKVSASCNRYQSPNFDFLGFQAYIITRVPVLDGHLACVDLNFQRKPPPSIEEVKDAMTSYVSDAQTLQCPSAPRRAIVVMEEPDRPQPRLDRETDKGYSVSVGRIRKDPSGIWDLKFVALSHNSTSCLSGLKSLMLILKSDNRSGWCFVAER